MSSRCGSADVLEALGVKIDLNPEQVQKCLKKVGIGFMLAPVFHPAMKFAAAPRKEVGIRTVFNILGPLTNPARAKAQVLGVPKKDLTEKMAAVLKMLDCQHALVVHGEDGLDEITVTGKTFIAELKDGKIRNYEITPEEVGLSRAAAETLKGGTAEGNAGIVAQYFIRPEGCAARHRADERRRGADPPAIKRYLLKKGLHWQTPAIDSGNALQKLEELSYSVIILYRGKHDSGQNSS